MMEFSVIIPCYNAEEYIDRSMASAVNQSFDKKNYEIIAVNDASVDNTLDKLLGWQNRFPELIKVISNEENLRQGGARNAAMMIARGEYICFLDADDRYDSDCLTGYHKLIEYSDADMVVTRHKDENVLNNEDSYEASNSDNSSESIRPSVIKILENEKDQSEIIQSDFGYVCCSAYRRSIIADNDIFFPEKLAYEDVYWPRIFELYAKKVCVSDFVTYLRYDNPVSTMNKKNAAHHVDRLQVYEMLLAKYEQLGILKNHYRVILNQTMETYYFNSYFMFFTRMDETPDVYSRIRGVIYHYFPDWEEIYDESAIPLYFQYLIKLLKKATNMSPEEMLPFKESLLEILE